MIDNLESFLLKLNDEQRQAATLSSGSAIVLAAAGSGKTSTLTTRIAYLILKKGIAPQNILAVTFTNKAAKEMSSRLFKMGIDVKNLWIGTFHGVCNKILRYHGELLGLKKNFYIMDSQEQESFFKRTLRNNGYDVKGLNVSYLLDEINSSKENGLRSKDLQIGSLERKTYECYEVACIANNCVDFGELLLGCYEIFKNHPEIAENYANKFKHILVDEFQDTNDLQYKWLKILAAQHKSIFAVGDDDQCFAGDVKVKTKTGDILIKDIKVGQKVFSQINEKLEEFEVVDKFEKLVNKKFVSITLSNGLKVSSTSEHVWFVAKKMPYKSVNDVDFECELYGGSKLDNYLHKIVDKKKGVAFNSSDLSLFTNGTEKNMFFKARVGGRLVDLVSAINIEPGDELFVLDNGFVSVVEIDVYEKEDYVYDINVKNSHAFFADGVLTHNSIYSFRGAKPENIHLLKNDFDAVIIKIEKNYRSDENILKAANAVIANNTNRMGKELVPTFEGKNKLVVFDAFNDEEESSFVANEIKNLRRTGIPYKNMAILYRTNGQSRSLEKALNTFAIPYIIYGGFRFFDRQEVKHAMAYLRLANNKHDNMAFLRVANIPVRSIGETTVKKLEVFATENEMSLFDAVNSWSDKSKKKFDPFIELIEHLERVCTRKSLPDMVKSVIIESGLERMYENDKKEGQERLDNLYELISAAEVFVAENKNADIEEFLSFSSLESDVGTKKKDENIDAVKLMTVHASKGLEFDCVFVTGLEESLFPHANSLGKPEAVEEERRLMYVAITRAKQKLYLSCSEERMIHGQRSRLLKSRFFKEIPQSVYEKIR